MSHATTHTFGGPRRRFPSAGWRLLTLVIAAVLLLGCGEASARTSRHLASAGHHAGAVAVAVAASGVKRIRGALCGRVKGRWVPGTIVAGGHFLPDAVRFRNLVRRARHERGAARRQTERHAATYARRAKRLQRLCLRPLARPSAHAGQSAKPPSPAHSGVSPGSTPTSSQTSGSSAVPGTSTAIPISQESLGQHLMFDSTVTPTIPVHAMRLWDSNTQWCQIDNGTATNQYRFGQLDALLGQAARLHADVEFTFGHTPHWAASGVYPQSFVSDQCTSGWNAVPADEAYWKNFVTAVVTHAKGKIRAYELWNEVDYAPYWSGNLSQMVQMTTDAAGIIHKIDPSALVLSPSITDSSSGYAFLKALLSALPAGTIDAIAVHSYTYGAWPEASVATEMSSLRAALPAAYARIPVWSTEGSWGLNNWFSTTPSDQRAFVARYDLMMLSQRFARSYWYAYQNTQWGTLWDGTQLTPAGIASRTLYGWLVGGVLRPCSSADGNLWTCGLTTAAGRSARIVWATHSLVWSYPTTGYRTLNTLSGAASATGQKPIIVTAEPVLLST